MAASDLIITLTRKELYERIWTTPMSALAKEFDITSGALAALCKSHDIPRPTCGHWSKARHGKAPEAMPLPSIENENRRITITPNSYYRASWEERMAEEDRMLERRRQTIIERELWERLTKMVEGWHEAQGIRSFLAALKKTVADDEQLADKAAELTSWAQDRLRRLDPMAYDPSLVFETMDKPVRMPEHWDLL